MSKIYVIIGTSGENPDIQEWIVGYKKTRDGADHYAKTCTEIAARLYNSKPPISYSDTAAHRLDPNWRQDYCATTYRVEVAEPLGRVGAAL